MQKNKIIKMLESIEGNPNIVFWNGMIDDWMDILPEVVEIELTRQSFDYWIRMIEWAEKRVISDSEKVELKKNYNKIHPWEYNQYINAENIKKGDWEVKKVKILQAKCRGVETFDRLGKISY